MNPEYIIDHQLFEPPPELKPYIRYSIFIHFQNKGQNIWFPADLRNQLIYLIDGKANLEFDEKQKKQDVLSIRGPFNKPLNISFLSDEVKVFCIEFTEHALNIIFDLQGESVLNQIENAYKLIPDLSLDTPKGNFSVAQVNQYFEKELLARINSKKLIKVKTFVKAVEICKTHKGKLSVEELSKITGLQKRTLNRQFIKYTGLSPKKYIHLLNLNRLLYELLSPNATKGSILAEKYGLYDESHLIRMIKKYAGVSPRKIEDFDTSWFEFISGNESKLS